MDQNNKREDRIKANAKSEIEKMETFVNKVKTASISADSSAKVIAEMKAENEQLKALIATLEEENAKQEKLIDGLKSEIVALTPAV
jgi:chaperonin cofactor prefoldin